MKKNYRYYYYDERKDDFANNGINGKPTPSDFDYYPKNPIFRFFRPIIYFLAVIVAHIGLFFCGVKVKNRKVLKNVKDKKKGVFIYGNHTGFFIDAATGPYAAFPRSAYVIVHPDALSIPGIKTLLRFWGALPTPSDVKSCKNFLSTIDTLYEKGKAIVIYPESHIWPKYNEIRDFSSVSFSYPAKCNAPCFTKTTVYKKKKNGKYKTEVYFDGPFYADESLSVYAKKEVLRNLVRNQMIKRVTEENSVLKDNLTYIKVDSPDKVRTEIVIE